MANMNNHKPNQSIHCCVKSCAHHCGSSNFCMLESIYVGTHETDPKMTQCTDCQSFSNVNRREQRCAAGEDRRCCEEKYDIMQEHQTNY